MQSAINAENIYIQNRLNNIETEPLIDILKGYGFETLEDYYKQKAEWQLLHCGIKEVNRSVADAFSTIDTLIQHELPSLLLVYHDYPFIWHGSKDYDLNQEAVDKYNIQVYEGGYIGGTIVGGAGDLSFGVVYPKTIDLRADYFLDKLVEIFRAEGMNAEKDHNDILIDKKKVIGSATLEGVTFLGFVVFISFSDQSEVIKEVCGINPKEPGYITKMTVEDLEDKLRKWLL